MSKLAATLRRRTALLAFTLAAVLSILFVLPPRPAAAIVCAQGFPSSVTYYYNDAQHTTRVGTCVVTCTQNYCTGQQTIYSQYFFTGCCTIP